MDDFFVTLVAAIMFSCFLAGMWLYPPVAIAAVFAWFIYLNVRNPRGW